MRIFFLVVALVWANLLPAGARTIYVSPTGTSDGTKSDRPMSLTKAEAEADVKTVNLLPGVYLIAKPLVIRGAGTGVTWQSTRRHAAILDGGGKAYSAVLVKGQNVTIKGLFIRKFTDDGIQISGASGSKIIGNRITDITSTKWSRGAIHGGTIAPGTLVEGNQIERTGYGGILFDTDPAGDLSNITIKRNIVKATCIIKDDCGAIYINGRSGRSENINIEQNVIDDFGPMNHLTIAIYLDDWISGAVVRENRISGRGSYAFHIHGGSNNLIYKNHVRIAGQLLRYQSNERQGPRAMLNNVLRANISNTLSIHILGARSGSPRLDKNISRPVARMAQ